MYVNCNNTVHDDVRVCETRRMAIANGTCVSFCNQPITNIVWLPKKSHAGMSSPSAVFRVLAFGLAWLRQESLRHIFASPGYAPGTIAVNVTCMARGFNACQLCDIYRDCPRGVTSGKQNVIKKRSFTSPDC